MSVEALVAAIDAEAQAEAAALLERAQVEATALVDAARRRAEARVAEARAAAERAARAEAARRLTAIRLRDVGAQAAALAGRLDRVFEEAARDLAAIADGGDTPRWEAALLRLAAEAAELTGPGATIVARPADASLLTAAPAVRGTRARVAVDPDLPPGIVARSDDGRVEVDATLPARLARARERLAGVVAARLGAEEPPGAEGALGGGEPSAEGDTGSPVGSPARPAVGEAGPGPAGSWVAPR
jgi:vacuolar-type H+-ATPase subunit E/Vma4